jgi:hypothetical protein
MRACGGISKARSLFRKDQTGLVIGKRVLLPIDEVLAGFDVQAVGQHAAAAVRSRAQAHHLGA